MNYFLYYILPGIVLASTVLAQNPDSSKIYYINEVLFEDTLRDYTKNFEKNEALQLLMDQNCGETIRYFTGGDQNRVLRTGRYYNQVFNGIKPSFGTPENLILMPMMRLDGTAGVLNEQLLQFKPSFGIGLPNNSSPNLIIKSAEPPEGFHLTNRLSSFGSTFTLSRHGNNEWTNVSLRMQGPWKFTKDIIEDLNLFSNQTELTANAVVQNERYKGEIFVILSTEKRDSENNSDFKQLTTGDDGYITSAVLSYLLNPLNIKISASAAGNKVSAAEHYFKGKKSYVEYSNRFAGGNFSVNNIPIGRGFAAAGAGRKEIYSRVFSEFRIQNFWELWTSVDIPLYETELSVKQNGILMGSDDKMRYGFSMEVSKTFRNLGSVIDRLRISAGYSKYTDPFIGNTGHYRDIKLLSSLPCVKTGSKSEMNLEFSDKDNTGSFFITMFYNRFQDIHKEQTTADKYLYTGIMGMLMMNFFEFSLVIKGGLYPKAEINEEKVPAALSNSFLIVVTKNTGALDLFVTYSRIGEMREGGSKEALEYYPPSDVLNLGAGYRFTAGGLDIKLGVKINYLDNIFSENNFLFINKKHVVPIFPEISIIVSKAL